MSNDIKFEDAMKRFEKIVSEMEGGKLTLEDSIKRYEEGVKLSQVCLKKLEAAKKKVEVLSREGSKIEAEPFEEQGLDK